MNSLSENTKFEFTAVNFDPFAEGEVLVTAPATASQKEIWASVQMGIEANCAYNESVSLRLTGELNLKALQQSFEQLVQRHEALRTTFSPDGNNLCINDAEIDISINDLSQWSHAERQQQVNQLRQQSVEKPFDLEHGPLFRVQILKLQPRSHLIILSAHHIICDGWSWAVLVTDLGQLYSASKQGTTAELEQSDRFSDYALMLEESADDPETIATEEYWIQQFSGSVPVVDFPTDRPRPPLRTFDSQREDRQISASLVTALKQLGTKFGCSFMTTLLSSFEVFMHRLTGQEDLAVGIPAAGQAATGNYNLVGHCVNLLPLRTEINSQESFSDYLQKRKITILDAYDRQQFTFGSLIQKLSLPRDPGRIPIIPIIFNVDQELDPNTLDFEGLEVEFASNPRAYENFEIYINVTELRGKLTLECQYNTNLFDSSTIRRRLAEFETLLTNIVANPNELIATIGLLPAAEQQLLKQWNLTETNHPQHLCIHQLVEAQAVKTPDEIAVVFEDRQITYQQLNQKANQLAHHLQTLGVAPEVMVGICVERSVEMVVGVLGILKAGGSYVPLDPSYPQERLSYMLADSGVEVLLTQELLLKSLPSHTAQVVCFDSDCEAIEGNSQENLDVGLCSDNLAYTIYTSGSTGKPKGVAMKQLPLVNLILWQLDNSKVANGSRTVQFAPISFDVSFQEIFSTLCSGGTLILISEEVRRDPQALLRLLTEAEIERLFLPFVALQQLAEGAVTAQQVPTSLREIITAGEQLKISPSIINLFQRLENCTLHNQYGPTESHVVTAFELTSSASSWSVLPPIGRPIDNAQIYLLDRNLQQVPIGVPGELYIGGVCLARGYLNRLDLTKERFIPDRFQDDRQARLYKTGDLARYLSDGNIEYIGRIDDQVKVRGFRIELGEIEAVMTEYSAVNEAVAIVREDTPGEKTLVGYFVGNLGNVDDANQCIPELRKFLKERLPDYMVPMVFVALDAMPHTPSGKVDRRALPQPDAFRPELVAKYAPPRNDLEQEIANIWAEVLNLEQVGIYDNFFELGGYSLLGTKIIARLRQNLQIKLLLSNLFELPTVAELATRIETLRWAAQSQASSEEVNEDYEEGEL